MKCFLILLCFQDISSFLKCTKICYVKKEEKWAKSTFFFLEIYICGSKEAIHRCLFNGNLNLIFKSAFYFGTEEVSFSMFLYQCELFWH